METKERAVVLLLISSEEVLDDLRDALPALERAGVVKDGELIPAIRYIDEVIGA
jgi:hypothetical protein